MQNDPRAYLETPARIIAEDDTHLVVAIRVEKAWFAQNLLFLGALADSATASSGPGHKAR